LADHFLLIRRQFGLDLDVVAFLEPEVGQVLAGLVAEALRLIGSGDLLSVETAAQRASRRDRIGIPL
jgi:hypothetical protein